MGKEEIKKREDEEKENTMKKEIDAEKIHKLKKEEKERNSRVTKSEMRTNVNKDEKEKRSKTQTHKIDVIEKKIPIKRGNNNNDRIELENEPSYENLDFEAMFCHHCDESLAGQRYAVKDDHPYCIKCFERVFANKCNACETIIGIDSEDISYKGNHWHHICFLCSICKTSLVNNSFGSNLDNIYCNSCHDANFGSTCLRCGGFFRTGMTKIECNGKQWHKECFICCKCESKICRASFVPVGKDIFCNKCYTDDNAAKCIRCTKDVTSDGITYHNQPWHMRCLKCTHCKKSLAKLVFTSREDKLYCEICLEKLFSKKCQACSKPKSGIDGARYISLNSCYWHSSCFCCASCSKSLVDEDFIREGEEILCIECAEERMQDDIPDLPEI